MRFGQLEKWAATAVEAVIRKLPPDVREAARAVTVHCEREPDATVLAEGFESDLLGLFQGAPRDADPGGGDLRPPQIILYLPSLWAYAEEDADGYKEEVRVTYLHELGHYLGWDEGQVTARGLD
ncbi:MAG: metallopeptidase family protein [Opitutaceae bacterium]